MVGRLPAELHRARNFDREAKLALRRTFSIAATEVQVTSEPGPRDDTIERPLRRMFPRFIDLARHAGATRSRCCSTSVRASCAAHA